MFTSFHAQTVLPRVQPMLSRRRAVPLRHGMAKPAVAQRNRTLTDHNARSPAVFSVQPYVVVYTTMEIELTDENVVALFAPNDLRHRQFVCIYVSTSTRKTASNLTTKSAGRHGAVHHARLRQCCGVSGARE